MLPAFTKDKEALKNEDEQKVPIGQLKIVITDYSKRVVRLGHCGESEIDCSFVKLAENVDTPPHAPSPCFPGFEPFFAAKGEIKTSQRWEQPPGKKIQYRYPVYESMDLEKLNEAFQAKDYVKYAEHAVSILEKFDQTNRAKEKTKKNTFSIQDLIDRINNMKNNFVFDFNTMTPGSKNIKGM